MIRKTSSSIRNSQKTAQESGSKRRIERMDLRHVVLPSPRFNVRSRQEIVNFLDQAEADLNDVEISDGRVNKVLRQIYGITHVAKYETPENWPALITTCRNHSLLKTLHEDPFVKRAFQKPRGYAGDAVLLDYIYDDEMLREPVEMSPIGRRLHQWTTKSSACNGVKARRAFIAEFIDRLTTERDRVEILSIACGHLREADISSALLRKQLARVVAIDSDAGSIDVVNRDYGKYGVETIPISARQMVTGKIDFGYFDFIYSAGLFDYLTDSNCRKLSSRWFSMLKPGGHLLLTNFFEGIEGVGFMEAFMDWNLVYRNRMQMMEMTQDIPEAEIANIHYFAEENQNVICILVQRGNH